MPGVRNPSATRGHPSSTGARRRCSAPIRTRCWRPPWPRRAGTGRPAPARRHRLRVPVREWAVPGHNDRPRTAGTAHAEAIAAPESRPRQRPLRDSRQSWPAAPTRWSGMGYDIVSLNIGNPGAFGFRTPETMRLAMIENLRSRRGLLPPEGHLSRRARPSSCSSRRAACSGVTAEEVFIGNGVSELIDLMLRALLATDDEVLVPSPGLSALDGGGEPEPRHAPCTIPAGRSADFVPDPEEIESLITPRTRAHRRHQSEQSDRRGVPARGAARPSCASPRSTSWCVQRRDLRPDDLRRRRIRADGDAGARHAVRHVERAVEGVSRLRLPRRLGVVLRRPASMRASTCRRSSC